MERIKSYASYLFGLATLVLAALFFRQSRKTETVESELAHEKSSTEIKLNDQAREAAAANANELVDAYNKLRDGDR